MPNLLMGLVIDRVDLVDEGANSEAFIEIYKRKERRTTVELKDILDKLSPDEASAVQKALDEASAQVTSLTEELGTKTEDLAKKNTELTDTASKLEEATAEVEKLHSDIDVLKAKGADGECECEGEANEDGICKGCGKPKKKAKGDLSGVDETELLKSMPESAREFVETLKAQKEAAEELVRKNADEAATAKAISKAACLKAIPVEQEKLVGIVKRCDDELLEVLETINSALEGAVLSEVGKNAGNGAKGTEVDAWKAIESAADEIAKRNGVTPQKAIALAITENPKLYNDYLNGGAK